MLKLVKSRAAAEAPASGPARPRTTLTAGRFIYLGLLAALGVGLAYYLFGTLIFFQADGLVTRDRIAVATTYVARVTEVAVKEGQQVKKGDILLRLESTEILERLADLSARRAELRVRLLDMQARLETAETLLPLADKREKEVAQVLEALSRVSSSGLVTTARYEEALRENYEASEILVRLDAEYRSIKSHVDEFQTALQASQASAADLEAHYARGIVRAPADGPVGASVPSRGEVIRPGETCLSIYSGDTYVLAYLPRRYLFPVRRGMKVTITSGRQSMDGTIAEILPLSGALPEAFQNTFEPQDRKQLAKVRLAARSVFPIGEKVRLGRIPF